MREPLYKQGDIIIETSHIGDVLYIYKILDTNPYTQSLEEHGIANSHDAYKCLEYGDRHNKICYLSYDIMENKKQDDAGNKFKRIGKFPDFYQQ